MQKYYLIGSPISHSMSPAMHNLAFSILGIDARYGLYETDISSLPDTIRHLKQEGASGWNVTMPCKRAMCDFCDVLSPSAFLSRSVNTVRNENGKLYGYTTDGDGFLRSVLEAGFRIAAKDITLLGTGGAAVSILIACALNGASHIHVFYNRESSADGIRPIITGLLEYMKSADAVSVPAISLNSLHDTGTMKRTILSTDLLVNATNVGMAGSGNDNSSPLSDISCLSAGTDIFDAIYNPPETVFLRQAKAAGLRTVNGQPMLIYQGAEAFRIWTGQEMPVEAVKEKIFNQS